MEALKYITYFSVFLWILIISSFFILGCFLFLHLKNKSSRNTLNTRKKSPNFNSIQHINEGDIVYYHGIEENGYEILSCGNNFCNMKKLNSSFTKTTSIPFIKKEFTKKVVN